jgi:hypothetical protein
MAGKRGEIFCAIPLDSPRALTYHAATRRQCLWDNGAQIAQLVEQRIENPRVAGSIPALGTIFTL